MSYQRVAFRVLIASTIGIIVAGTTFYRFVEDLSWVDAYYFSVITLTTVGYGDVSPQTDAGKIFTTLYILIGVGIITAFITNFAQYRMTRRAKK